MVLKRKRDGNFENRKSYDSSDVWCEAIRLKKQQELMDMLGIKDSLDSIGVARIFDWGGPNHKLPTMTSSEVFKKGTFCGAKIS